ncbi:hypothetical protein [Xenorhabdus szentirmaii]|uniref:hypothetical protein n=1 Tax=Xenorhabdus szentirmaii TaxID=290112 RepID=UPI0019C2095D|nr:hypothetical protein [Xenorhabdus sp. 38]MBD2782867.1 hypothetical protein [Xenorhabdus sp. 38]
MICSIYKYKVESFFSEVDIRFDNEFLFYQNDFEERKHNNKKLFFKEKVNGEYTELSSWWYVFKEYISKEYWNLIPDEFINDKGILGFVDLDYYNVDLILNRFFFIFDVNKEIYCYRKELTELYCQYQVSHYKGKDCMRLSLLKRLLGEVWVWDLAYNSLSINNDELIFTSESGFSYNFHDVIEKMCDIIRFFSLPEHLLKVLDFINTILHECIDFILGKNGIYDFNFDDVNLKYIDGNHFLDTYQSNKEEILNVLKGCLRGSQSFSELFVSHMIVMNYSFFVLKDHPNDITLLQSFFNDDEDIFIDILSLIMDVGFYVSEKRFSELNLGKYLDKIEKSDFLIDKSIDRLSV